MRWCTQPMATVLRSLCILLGVLSAAGGTSRLRSSSPPLPQGPMCDTDELSRRDLTARALEHLSKDFKVIQGNLSFHPGGNPGGKYGIVHFPAEAYPPVLRNMSRLNISTGGFPIPLNASFSMGPRDAVVWLGCTPPPVRYFSIRSYLAFRFDPEAFMPAAEFSDPLNHLLFNTTGGQGSPFSKTALLVSTGDAATHDAVVDAFESFGFPRSASNLDVVASDVVHFRHKSMSWLREKSDLIAWQFRVNEFMAPSLQNDEYLRTVWPVYLLQARESFNEAVPPRPLITPPLRPRGTGELQEWLRGPMDELVTAVSRYMKDSRGLELSHVFPMYHLLPDVRRCMSDVSYCPIAAPVPAWNLSRCIPTCDWYTRDSLYSQMPSTTDFDNLIFPLHRTFVVVGVNQPLAGKCSFLNLLATDVAHPEQVGHTSNYSSSELAGSGTWYLPSRPESRFLYAQALSRTCLPGESYCRQISAREVQADGKIYFAERKYLEEATRIGPSPDEILPPLILAFDPPSPATAAVSSPSSPSAADLLEAEQQLEWSRES